MNVATHGDLFSRQIDKGKSVGKGMKKQQKDNSSVRGTGVQTITTLSKLIISYECYYLEY